MFGQETIRFLKDLQDHNERDWFQSQKQCYETHVKSASKAFAASLRGLLSCRYDANVEAKIYRINRDLRFSKDKAPYNTHVHLSFLDPEMKTAWMVGLETDRLVLGYGAFTFDPDTLKRWRERVSGPAGLRLLGILQKGDLRLDPPELKRVPAGYPSDHPASDLLRRKSFALWVDGLPPSAAFGEAAPERVADKLRLFDPVRDWFVEEFGGAGKQGTKS